MIHIEDLAPLLVSPDVTDRFFKYKGSLTTPGCFESVTWFVMNSHPQITEKEVSKNLTVPRQFCLMFAFFCFGIIVFEPVIEKPANRRANMRETEELGERSDRGAHPMSLFADYLSTQRVF